MHEPGSRIIRSQYIPRVGRFSLLSWAALSFEQGISTNCDRGE